MISIASSPFLLALLISRVAADFVILYPNATTVVELFEDFTIRYNASDSSNYFDPNITLYTGAMDELEEIDRVATNLDSDATSFVWGVPSRPKVPSGCNYTLSLTDDSGRMSLTNYFGISNPDDGGLPDDVLCEGGVIRSNKTTSSSPRPRASSSASSSSFSTPALVGAIVGSVIGVVALTALILYVLIKKHVLMSGKELQRRLSAEARLVEQVGAEKKDLVPHHLDSTALSELDAR